MISPIATSTSPTTHNAQAPSHTTAIDTTTNIPKTTTEPSTTPNIDICTTTPGPGTAAIPATYMIPMIPAMPAISNNNNEMAMHSYLPRHNNQTIDITTPAGLVAVDESAYHFYTPDYKGGRHRGDGRVDCNINKIARKAKNRYVKSLVECLKKCGSFEQQRLALRDALGHPEVRDVASSIGLKVEEATIGLDLLSNIKKTPESTQQISSSSRDANASRNCKTITNAIVLSCVHTPPADPTKKMICTGGISDRSLFRKSNLSQSKGTRLFGRARNNKRKIRDGDISGYVLLHKNKKRSKYDEPLIDELRDWMLNNVHVQDIGNKNETVIKRDLNGKLYLFEYIY